MLKHLSNQKCHKILFIRFERAFLERDLIEKKENKKKRSNQILFFDFETKNNKTLSANTHTIFISMKKVYC